MERADELAEEGAAGAVSRPGEAGAHFWRETLKSLGNPTFRTFWLGMVTAYAAFQVSFVVRGYLAFQLGGTATAVGLIGLARAVPATLVAPVSGAVADRVDRRSLLIVTLGLAGILALVNALLNLADLIRLWHLALLMAGEGILFSLNWPSRQAMVAQIVSREELPNAVALSSVAQNLSGIGGPALAGILIGLPLVGVGGTLVGVTVLFAAGAAVLLNLPRRSAHPLVRAGPVMGEMKAGLDYIRQSPTLIVLLVMALVPLLLGFSYYFVLPVFQERVFHVGSAQLGLMYTVSGVGALLGSLAAAILMVSPHKARWQLLLGLAFGLGLFLFAAAGSFTMALPALALVGFSSNAYLSINNALILLNSHHSHHGRVSSYLMLSWALLPAFSLPLGMLVDAVGAQVAVGSTGLLIVLFLLAFASLSPSYRRMAAAV